MGKANSVRRRGRNHPAIRTKPPHLTKGDKLRIDILTFLLSYFAAFFITFEGIPDPVNLRRLLLLLPGVVLARILCFLAFSVTSIVWKYVSVIDAARMLIALLPVTAALLLGRILLPAKWPLFRLPLSVIALEFLFALVGTLGARLTRRVAYELSGRSGPEKRRTLLIGAGGAGSELLEQLGRRVYSGIEVLGFVDDDPNKFHTVLRGVRVLGNTSQIPEIVEKLHIDEAIITIGTLPLKDVGRIIDVCKGAKIRVRIFHSVFKLLLDEARIPDVPHTDPEAAAQEELQIFRNVTGRDYDPAAEARYPIDHIYEVNKPFSDPEGLSGDLLMATGTMIKLLNLAPGTSVLDLGCGCGWTSIMLARCGFRVTGLDMNAASLEIGRRNAEAIGIPVRFMNADMQRFTVDQLFDAVVMFDSLHHCLRERSVLSGAESALRHGGKILLCEQNYPDEDLAGILTHEAAVQAMRQHGTLEKGLGTRYLIRSLFDCGFETATVFTTRGHYRTWIMARKPRPGAAAARRVIYTSDFDIALRQYR